jgi:hypothetical protein
VQRRRCCCGYPRQLASLLLMRLSMLLKSASLIAPRIGSDSVLTLPFADCVVKPLR